MESRGSSPGSLVGVRSELEKVSHLRGHFLRAGAPLLLQKHSSKAPKGQGPSLSPHSSVHRGELTLCECVLIARSPKKNSCGLEVLKCCGFFWKSLLYSSIIDISPVVMYRCQSWTIKKAEHQRIDVFKLWCWRRLLRIS